ncbi:MAG: hypothetical protein ACR2RV_03710 [Verrucomicrobiales bacterium]
MSETARFRHSKRTALVLVLLMMISIIFVLSSSCLCGWVHGPALVAVPVALLIALGFFLSSDKSLRIKSLLTIDFLLSIAALGVLIRLTGGAMASGLWMNHEPLFSRVPEWALRISKMLN